MTPMSSDVNKSNSDSIDIVLPGSGGLYHYWFGVIACLQHFLPMSHLNRLRWHTVSGTGFPVAVVHSNLCVVTTYEIWEQRLAAHWGKLYQGYPWYYRLLCHQCEQIVTMSQPNASIGKHIIRTFDLNKMQQRMWVGERQSIAEYSKLIVTSALVPGLMCRLWCSLHDGHRHLDGSIAYLISADDNEARDYTASLSKSDTPRAIHMEEVCGYQSVVGWRPMYMLLGMFQCYGDLLFQNGWEDCYKYVIQTELITASLSFEDATLGAKLREQQTRLLLSAASTQVLTRPTNIHIIAFLIGLSTSAFTVVCMMT